MLPFQDNVNIDMVPVQWEENPGMKWEYIYVTGNLIVKKNCHLSIKNGQKISKHLVTRMSSSNRKLDLAA